MFLLSLAFSVSQLILCTRQHQLESEVSRLKQGYENILVLHSELLLSQNQKSQDSLPVRQKRAVSKTEEEECHCVGLPGLPGPVGPPGPKGEPTGVSTIRNNSIFTGELVEGEKSKITTIIQEQK